MTDDLRATPTPPPSEPPAENKKLLITEDQDGNLTRVETDWGAVEVQPAGGCVFLRIVSPDGDVAQQNLEAPQASLVAEALKPLSVSEPPVVGEELRNDLVEALQLLGEAWFNTDWSPETNRWIVDWNERVVALLDKYVAVTEKSINESRTQTDSLRSAATDEAKGLAEKVAELEIPEGYDRPPGTCICVCHYEVSNCCEQCAPDPTEGRG